MGGYPPRPAGSIPAAGGERKCCLTTSSARRGGVRDLRATAQLRGAPGESQRIPEDPGAFRAIPIPVRFPPPRPRDPPGVGEGGAGAAGNEGAAGHAGIRRQRGLCWREQRGTIEVMRGEKNAVRVSKMNPPCPKKGE